MTSVVDSLKRYWFLIGAVVALLAFSTNIQAMWNMPERQNEFEETMQEYARQQNQYSAQQQAYAQKMDGYVQMNEQYKQFQDYRINKLEER